MSRYTERSTRFPLLCFLFAHSFLLQQTEQNDGEVEVKYSKAGAAQRFLSSQTVKIMYPNPMPSPSTIRCMRLLFTFTSNSQQLENNDAGDQLNPTQGNGIEKIFFIQQQQQKQHMSIIRVMMMLS